MNENMGKARVKVISYNQECDFYDCRDGNGESYRIDLLVSGELREAGKFNEQDDPETLVGKTVEWEWSSPYIVIAHGVRIIE